MATTGPEATRERILAAALEVFAERGFEGARTREIASRAGVQLGLLRYHFGPKEQLWRAAVDRAFARMRAALREPLDDASLGHDSVRIGRLVRAHVRFVARHPEFVRLMLDEGKRKGPRMRWLVDRHVRPLYETVLEGVAVPSARGPLTRLPPAHLFYLLTGSMELLFHQAAECRRLAGVDPTDPDVVEAHARAVEHLLLRGLGLAP